MQHRFHIALSAGVISLLHVELLSEQNHCQKSYLSYCEVELLCFMLGCRTCTAFHFLLWAHISLPPHTITGWQLNRGEVFKVSLSIDFFFQAFATEIATRSANIPLVMRIDHIT